MHYFASAKCNIDKTHFSSKYGYAYIKSSKWRYTKNKFSKWSDIYQVLQMKMKWDLQVIHVG